MLLNRMLFNETLLRIQNTVTSDTVDIVARQAELLATIKSMSIEEITLTLIDSIVLMVLRIALAFAVFYIGKFIINRLFNIVSKLFVKKEVEASLASFLLSLLRIVLLFILVITIIGILGIETTSFVAIFASAGVAIGMALSGTLQNFAGGVIILLTKPYRVGDYIEISGLSGTVKEIQIFSTVLNTPDNKTIIVPNGGLSTGTINNYSTEIYRRIDWLISISYGDDIKVAREAIIDILNNDDRIVKTNCSEDYIKRPQIMNRLSGIIPKIPEGDKSPNVVLEELAADSVNLKVRAWVYSSFYWDVYYTINETIYYTLPQKGINFPFPQLDVRIQK